MEHGTALCTHFIETELQEEIYFLRRFSEGTIAIERAEYLEQRDLK